jgi:adenosylcobinamide kinase/adenosylcobinamide-phosphate guanylyltransferase
MRAGAPGDPDTRSPDAVSPVGLSPDALPLDGLFTVGLRMGGRLAVAIGGGSVAERWVARLLAAGAEVLVVAPELSAALEELVSGGNVADARGLSGGEIRVRRRGYVTSDLDGAWLVLACTGQRQVDDAVAADAERRRIWCGGADADGAAATDGASLSWEQARAAPSGDDNNPMDVTFNGTQPDESHIHRVGNSGVGASPSARRVLVLGGARSGKSATAERLLAGHARVDYIATGPVPGSGDLEWGARVLVHQQRRPAAWRTIETLDVEREFAAAGPADGMAGREAAQEAGHAGAVGSTGVGAAGEAAASVLVDCLSTWLAGVMDECGIWAGRPGADRALARRVDTLVEAWRITRRHVVAVSSEVGSGVVPGTVSGRRFRDELGSLNARIAAESDEVWLCTAGIARRLR